MADRSDRDSPNLIRVTGLELVKQQRCESAEIHQGQQASACINRPDINLQPYLSILTQEDLAIPEASI